MKKNLLVMIIFSLFMFQTVPLASKNPATSLKKGITCARSLFLSALCGIGSYHSFKEAYKDFTYQIHYYGDSSTKTRYILSAICETLLALGLADWAAQHLESAINVWDKDYTPN